nr:MAG TPA: hypothetical protein [Caudoviricetes sp.]
MAAEKVNYSNTLVSDRADETLTYTRYVKDESSGKSAKELLDEKVNKTDQLDTTQIADKAVTTEKLENESVTTEKLDAASVTTDKVADANITTSKLADSSIETSKINNKAVTTEKLNDQSVDNSKIAPNAVTSEKIKNESIITEKLNDRAVTTEKVEEKAITNTKLGDQSVDGRVVREASLETKHLANESVTTDKVARKSITKDKIAEGAVDETLVKDGSIVNSKLSKNAVSTDKIENGSVTNEKLASGTLKIDKFDPELRKAIESATGLPDNLVGMIQDVDESLAKLNDTVYPIILGFTITPNVGTMQTEVKYSVSSDGKPFMPDYLRVSKNINNSAVTAPLTMTPSTGGTLSTPIEGNKEIFGFEVTKKGRTGKSTSQTRYLCYFGGNPAATMTAEILNTLNKVSATGVSFNPSITTKDNDYIWLVVPSYLSISRVTSAGFDVTLAAPQTISNDLGSFKAYRTANPLTASTWNLVIS